MATENWTPSLGLALPTDGDLDGTWGQEINDKITTLVEEAVCGVVTINTWDGSDTHTLTLVDGQASDARHAVLILTDTGVTLGGQGTLNIPNQQKTYIVRNDTNQSIVVKTAAGTGVTIPDTNTSLIFCDGVSNGTTYLSSDNTNLDSRTITNSTIDSSVIGGTTPAAGTFDTLVATGGIDSTVIGGTTPAAGTFDTLVATGGIDSTVIGGTQAAVGSFTTANANIVDCPDYRIGGQTVLQGSTLTSVIINSSLETVSNTTGITSGVWNATPIASNKMVTATDSAQGAVEVATNQEVIDGLLSTVVATPAGIQDKFDDYDWDTGETDPQARTSTAWVPTVKLTNEASSTAHPTQPTDIQVMSQAEYDDVGFTPDANTLYFIVG
jgi:hypothetical protein